MSNFKSTLEDLEELYSILQDAYMVGTEVLKRIPDGEMASIIDALAHIEDAMFAVENLQDTLDSLDDDLNIFSEEE
jgi:hypothetical protein